MITEQQVNIIGSLTARQLMKAAFKALRLRHEIAKIHKINKRGSGVELLDSEKKELGEQIEYLNNQLKATFLL